MVVLVCMVGHDYQRIVDGINHWRIQKPLERIYLLYDKKRDKYGTVSQRNVKDLQDTLAFAGSKPVVLGYNPQSYEDTFCTLYMILKKEVEDNRREVLIDSTSTTKEAYGATVTISLMFEKVRIYIVPPLERGWYVPSVEAPVFTEWFLKTRSRPGMPPQEIYLPGYRLEQPNEQELKVLLELERHGGRSDSLMAIIRWCGENPRDAIIKNRYSRLIRRLEKRGFIQEEPSAKRKRVSLTGFGKTFAEAVKMYLSEVSVSQSA